MSEQTVTTNSEDTQPAASAVETKAGSPKPPNVVWDDSNMKMHYANVVNATCTREEVNIFFGLNQAWNGTEKEFNVNLTDRIMLNPFTAKRLMQLLTNLLQDYESRNCKLDVEVRDRQPSV